MSEESPVRDRTQARPSILRTHASLSRRQQHSWLRVRMEDLQLRKAKFPALGVAQFGRSKQAHYSAEPTAIQTGQTWLCQNVFRSQWEACLSKGFQSWLTE